MNATHDAMPDGRLLRILPAAFAVSAAIGLANLGMIFLIKGDYGASPVEVGWLSALWAAAYFVGCLAFRPLSRRLDASGSAAIACFASALLLAAQFALPSLASAFVASSLYGLACALFWPRLMGWLASGLEGGALTRASGTYSLAWSLGMIVSPFAAGALSERGRALGFGGALPVYAGSALFAAAGLFLALSRGLAPAPRPVSVAVRACSGDEAASAGHAAPRCVEDTSSLLRYPAWIGLFAAYILLSILSNIFPLYAKDELHLGESTIGLFLLVRAVAMAAGFWAFSRLTFWRFKPACLPLALAVAIALNLAFAVARGPLAILVGLILLGLVQAFSYSLSIFYGASGAADREKRMSVHEAVLTVGSIVGSVGGGFAYQGISWPAVFWCSAGLSLLCLPFILYLSRNR